MNRAIPEREHKLLPDTTSDNLSMCGTEDRVEGGRMAPEIVLGTKPYTPLFNYMILSNEAEPQLVHRSVL